MSSQVAMERKDGSIEAGDQLPHKACRYPEDGAVLIVSTHQDGDAVAPVICGWQVVVLGSAGQQRHVKGGTFRHVQAARTFAEERCGNIAGWGKLSATVWSARVRVDSPAVDVAPTTEPPRRANGLRIPEWQRQILPR